MKEYYMVNAAYEVDGELEYLTDRNGEPHIFESIAEAELLLLQEGIPADDIKYLRFLEAA